MYGAPSEKEGTPWWIAGDLLIGVIIAFVMALIKKTKLKSVKSQVTAGAYEKAGSLDLTVRTDYFVNRVVTTRKIERKQESGGSSVHTGSSGKSHGDAAESFNHELPVQNAGWLRRCSMGEFLSE